MMHLPAIKRWYFVFGFFPSVDSYNTFDFQFGIFKPTAWPPAGEVMSRKNYKGFWIRKKIKRPKGFIIQKQL